MPSPRSIRADHPDVLIVGAGLAGTSLAWHLSRAGLRVRVCEQGTQACAEASAQNAGMIRRLVADPDERTLVCRSWQWLHEDLGADWADHPPFRRTGSLVAVTELDGAHDRRLAKAAAQLCARGVTVEVLDDAAARARFAPALAGSDTIRRGYFIADDGVCDPHALGMGFVRGARSRGARFHFDTRIVELRRTGQRVIGVTTADGESIDASVVVLATAAWTDLLTEPLAPESHRLTPLGRHLFYSDPHPLATREHPWCWIEDVGLYVRPETGGFLVSPCDELPRVVTPGPGSSGPIEPAARARAHDLLQTHLPALAGLRLGRGWVGLRTFARDRRPVVGFDAQHAGIFWLTGLGGAGVGGAFALGERAAAALQRGLGAPHEIRSTPPHHDTLDAP